MEDIIQYLPELISGLSIGFLGSMHCIGMCGPIALAIPNKKITTYGKIIEGLIYNSGRIFTYMFLGLLLGLIGDSFSLAGWQNYISIFSGILILSITFLFPQRISQRIKKIKIINIVSEKYKLLFSKSFQKEGYFSFFIIGILNGFLPCGLVYLALIASFAMSGMIESILFMMFFGLGTLPAMFFAFMMKSFIRQDLRRKLLKLVPLGASIVAILLILRGLNLNIPYISPLLPKTVLEEIPPCCR